MLRRLPADCLAAFGVRLMLAESFTDPASHAGTVYAACNFTAIGQTAGYGRSRGPARYVHHGRPKTCWLYELAPGGLAALPAGFDSPALTGRRAPDFNALDVDGEHGLLGYLGKVADHRKPKGVRHGLAAILAVIVVARLSGADSVYAAAQFAATMPQQALRRCGIRYNARLGRYVPPSPKTIKRAVRAVDARAADEQMCAWLRAEAAAGRLNMAAHRHRRQDRPRRRPARRHPPAPAGRLRRHRRNRPGPDGRRYQDQRDHLLRPPAAGHPRRPRRQPRRRTTAAAAAAAARGEAEAEGEGEGEEKKS